jgi:hypothetical protein
MPDINLSPYTAENAAIQRRLQMAQILGQQAIQPLEVPQQAGVRASHFGGLAKVLQGYMAGSEEKSALEAYKDLANKQFSEEGSDFTNLMKALTKPATEGQPQGPSTFVPNVDIQQVANNPRMRVMPERNEFGEIIPQGQAGAGYFGEALGAPAVAPTGAGQLNLEDAMLIKTPQGRANFQAQYLAQVAPKEATVLPEGASLVTKQGRVLIEGRGKEDWHQPRNEFDPVSGQTLTVSYSNKGNRKVIETKGAFTPDQWNSIPVADRARLIFDQYKFGNVSATDMMQAAQKNVQLGQEFAKLGFDIGKNTSAGGVNIPSNAPMPALPLNGMTPPVSNVPVSGAPAVPVAPPAGGRYTPFNAPQRAATPPTPTTPTNVAPQPESNLIIDQVTPKERQVLLVAKPQAITGATTSLQNIDRLTNVAKELSDHPGLSRITGKLNQFSTFDTTAEATSARALQSTLVKQAAVNALQSMREASKTGGAVGAVTEGEWPILEQQLAALDGAQKPQDYKIALTNLQAQLKSSSERIRNAYEMTYGPLPYTAPQYTTQGRDAPPAGAVRRIR